MTTSKNKLEYMIGALRLLRDFEMLNFSLSCLLGRAGNLDDDKPLRVPKQTLISCLCRSRKRPLPCCVKNGGEC